MYPTRCRLICSVLDAAHVPFAHHGSGQGDRNKISADGFDKIVPGADDTFSVKIHRGLSSWMRYIPPTGIFYEFGAAEEGANPKFSLIAMASPSGRGKTRAITMFVLGDGPKFVKFALKLVPRWWQHTRANLILDSDAVLLRGQERMVQTEDNDGFGGGWRAMYVLKNGTWDRPVGYFRNWVDRNSKGMPWESAPRVPSVGEEMPRESIIDRFNSHTKDCKSCLGALKNMRVIRVVCGVVGVLAAFVIIAAGVVAAALGSFTPALWKLGTGAGVVELLALAVFAVCQKYIPLLLYSNIGHELATSE